MRSRLYLLVDIQPKTQVSLIGIPLIEYVITIFMFIGATNMTLVYFCFNGNVKKLIKDEEFRWFFFFCFKRYYRCHGVDLVPWIRLGCRECVP